MNSHTHKAGGGSAKNDPPCEFCGPEFGTGWADLYPTTMQFPCEAFLLGRELATGCKFKPDSVTHSQVLNISTTIAICKEALSQIFHNNLHYEVIKTGLI